MLEETRIRKLYERFKKKAEKYFYAYQDSGVAQYYSEFSRQQELADLAERALTSATDHDCMMHYRTLLHSLGTAAFDAIHSNQLDDYRDVVKELAHVVKMNGIATNRWE